MLLLCLLWFVVVCSLLLFVVGWCCLVLFGVDVLLLCLVCSLSFVDCVLFVVD